jgi:leucyl aminopeptidase
MRPKLEVTRRPLQDVRADAVVLFVREGEPIEPLPEAVEAIVREEAERRRFRGKAGQVIVVQHGEAGRRQAIVAVGLGRGDALDGAALRTAAGRAAGQVQQLRSERVAVVPPQVPGEPKRPDVRAAVEGILGGLYRYERYLGDPDRASHRPERLLVLAGGPGPGTRRELNQAQAVFAGIERARDLVNGPPDDVYPESFAAAARKLGRMDGLTVRVLGPRELERERMNALLAVGRGSAHPPRLVHVAYRPGGKRRERLAWIGKGITFDAGGYNIKPTNGIETMKCDMAGAAAVLGAISVLPALAPDVEVHAVMPLAENLVSGNAYKPGDVLTTRSGKTVEINNTDAEGRLALADALDWVREKIEPTAIVDLATLTGACVVALGQQIAGLMSPDDALGGRVAAAAARAGEAVWRLPLPQPYREMLDSPIADMKNSGGRWAGALSAGLFLAEFAGDTPWAHLDIAGPAFADKKHPFWGEGGTGFGVATLVEMTADRR